MVEAYKVVLKTLISEKLVTYQIIPDPMTHLSNPHGGERIISAIITEARVTTLKIVSSSKT